MADEKPKSIAVLPSPQILQLYSDIDPNLPTKIVQAAIDFNNQEYRYAQTQGAYGFILSLAVVCGAIYVAIHGHDWVAGTLLGAGAVGMVTGFQFSRLGDSKPPTKAKGAKASQVEPG